MDVHISVARNLTPARTEERGKRSTWTAPMIIALLALVAIAASSIRAR